MPATGPRARPWSGSAWGWTRSTACRPAVAGRRICRRGRLPILLPLRRLGAYLRARRPVDDGTEGHKLLLDHLYECLAAERVSLPGDFFDPYLEEGRAVVLLDGLDEVADPDLRRRVSRLVEAFTAAYPACRYVVASRIVGYSGAARLGEGYATTTVREFTMADVERFLRNWHLAVAVGQMGPGESAMAYGRRSRRGSCWPRSGPTSACATWRSTP